MLYKNDLVSEFGSEGRRRLHLEDDLQASVCTFLRWALPVGALSWSVPNGGLRHSREAARMSRLGVRAGIPDLHVVYLGKLHCLELKAPKGTLSALQVQTIDRLGSCGVPTVVVKLIGEVEAALRGWGIPLNAKLT